MSFYFYLSTVHSFLDREMIKVLFTQKIQVQIKLNHPAIRYGLGAVKGTPYKI